jgi:tetratricopeptide (TPR) repeat protein
VGELTRSPDLDRQPAATLSFLCSALQATGQDSLHREVLRRAQWKYPGDFWINQRLGVNLIWTRVPQNMEEGMSYLRAALALRPNYCHSFDNLGNGYFLRGELDEAIACYRKAVELHPRESSHLNNLGEALVKHEMFQEAISVLQKSVEFGRSNAGPYGDLAMILCNAPDVRLRDYDRAEELAATAVKLAPTAGNFWTALGVARYRHGKWPEACEALEKSLKLGTGGLGGGFRWPDAIDWLFLAMSHRQMGHVEDSRRCYEQAVTWIETNKQHVDETVRRLRAEADELLKQPTK